MATKNQPAGKAGKTLADFRAAHDKNYIVPKKIQEGLDRLGDSWEYEVDFIRSCGLPIQDFANFRDQFEEYCVVVNSTDRARAKRVYAGTKALAAKMREMV